MKISTIIDSVRFGRSNKTRFGASHPTGYNTLFNWRWSVDGGNLSNLVYSVYRPTALCVGPHGTGLL